MNINFLVFVQQCAAMALWVLIVVVVYSGFEKLFPDFLTQKVDDPARSPSLASDAGLAQDQKVER